MPCRHGLGDDQIVDVEVVVVLGVGDRRFQALLDVDRDPLARELQVGERRATFLPRISCATRLSFCGLTRSMRATALASLSARLRSRFGLLIATSSSLLGFLVAAWPWKVRVGENSPNL
jgi:hypothetical protein